MLKFYSKKRQLKLKFRAILVIITTFLFVAGIIMIVKGYNNQKNNEIIYSYDIKNNVTYDVDLYNNSVFEETKVGMDETYVSNMVKAININFDYEYENNKNIDLSYQYNIKEIVNGEYVALKDDKKSKVWTKTFSGLDTIYKETNENKININEPITIDFSEFNKVVDEFKNQTNLAISAYLSVKFEVKVIGSVNNKAINDTSSIILNIPLNQPVFKITSEYEKDINKEIKALNEKELKREEKKVYCGIILVILSVIIELLTYKSIWKTERKSKYNTWIDKVLKEYGDIIVEVSSPINKENKNIVELKNFNELLDLEDELKMPILFYEVEESSLGEFTIICNDYVYVLTVKDASKDLDNK